MNDGRPNGPRALGARVARTDPRAWALIALAALGAVLVWTRMRHLDQSLWHDEAFSVLNYSGSGPGAILFGDSSFDPNNHVLYNLLSWATASVVAPTEGVYRAWSVIPGIAAVGLLAWWSWRRLTPAVALVLTTLAVVSPLHADQVPYARGYGLALLAASATLIAADRLAGEPSARRLAAFVAAGLVGVATLYSFALVLGGQALALAAQPRLRRPILIGTALAGIAALVFYGPVLKDLVDTRPVFAGGISAVEALTLAIPLQALAFIGAPAWIELPALALVVWAAVALVRRGERDLALNLLLPPLVMNVAFWLLDAPPEGRFQLVLLPYVLTLVSLGLVELGRALARARPLRPVVVGVAIVLAVWLSGRTIGREEVGKAVPVEDPKGAAAVVEGTGIDRVITDSIRPQGLRFYLGDRLRATGPQEVERITCRTRRPLIYVRHLPLDPADLFLYDPAPLACLRKRDALRVRVPQRLRGETIDVWILRPHDPRGPN